MINTDLTNANLKEFIDTIGQHQCLPNRLALSPEQASKGLVQLALSIVNLLKEVMEKQAMRKMDNQQLTSEQIENLGNTFMLLEERMDELKDFFSLTDSDLEINLGQLMTLDER
ncbi:MAG: gas vesicle protein K [Flammeovirgaceae bacterium]